ncbi:ribonuclease HII [Nitrincola tapanii]|uniref:Ribonuclease HII n=1 Tax=Nitrincola tapanii TaxID=1708751 RepID=A0A5A9W1S9_9GAMM|nr:ribonuclease HII [Nitrincola tapanii]KAA0874676.1 ribonuclease HII [Nitrincola tapanii]
MQWGVSLEGLAGVDEVGRGPLVGNVVAAAVILHPERPISGLTDSKKLSEKKRRLLDLEIREKALDFAIAFATPAEIDELNILQASLLAMHRAVAALAHRPELVLVDGKHLPHWPYRAKAVIGGDASVEQISAASILAKVYRDQEMLHLHQQYPQYAFDQHKGYPTAQHLAALRQWGALPEHRRSFRPVRQVLQDAL